MKTGRPGQYIPSPSTVSHDVKTVFKKPQKQIAKMLQEHDGALNFATNTWTSPNHKAFIAITVHCKVNGIPLCMLLNLVEVSKSHSGFNLAATFVKIMDDFGILTKVSWRGLHVPALTYHAPKDPCNHL
jgi:hypothetical protein